jgi:DNA-directed RNA polymerase subunit RPC12/RpoP
MMNILLSGKYAITELRQMSDVPEQDTIFDRPLGLRLIGLTQMAFGLLGLIAAIGLMIAAFRGFTNPLYAAAVFLGVAIPCLIIGNFVDDLRRWAVVAQMIYSISAVSLTGFLLAVNGINYTWTVPVFGFSILVAIGNVSAFILITQSLFVAYLVVRWKSVAPSPGVHIERDRAKAKMIEEGLMPTPLEPRLLAPDGTTPLTPEETERILEVRKMETEEGMAILCSNCGGATPLTKAADDNTIECEYCGVRLAVGGVFVPCENHPEYLAATSCAVCGEHFCRRCLTAQEPPVDERWLGSSVYLCQRCFEGRYRPAVTTSSLVIPIDELFDQAGTRFSRVGSIYRNFLGKYVSVMRHVLEVALRFAGSIMRSSRGRKSDDNAIIFLIMVVIVIIAIPLAIGALLLIGALVIIPALFYAGLIGVMVEAVRILSGTDFVSLEKLREQGLKKGKSPKQRESTLRSTSRPWQNPTYAKTANQQYKETFFRRG